MRRSIFILLFCIFSACEQKQSCDVYFSPNDHLAKRVVELIDQEEDSVHLAIYCLTHKGVIDALARAKDRGVDVALILDPFSLSSAQKFEPLKERGVPLYVWNKKKGIMHNKFCVFGKERVWTGSFNFTYRADRSNRENALFIKNPKLAAKYLSQFEEIIANDTE